MVDLDFAVERARVATHAVAPLLIFTLVVTNRTPEVAVENVLLRCQIRIEPTRRRYTEGEQDLLLDLFGVPSRWGETARPFLWTHTSVQIGAFATECTVDLPVPCSHDFNLAATKYFHALADGEAPLSLLFSGSVFYRDEEDRLQIDQLSWEREARFRLPAEVWHDMMHHYYPGAAWLCLGRDAFEQLYRYKRHRGLATWDRAIAALVAAAETEAPP